MSRGEVNADPVQAEFFTPEGVTDSLVRETIQNSLDAAASPRQTVRVRFHIHEVPAGRATGYLDGLDPHLRPHDLALPAGRVRCLVVEDFGTRGLAGDPGADSDDTTGRGRRNDFFYFWRNVGRSRKERTDLGRWGLGKTVLPAASEINAFFGLTRRPRERHGLLMGQAVLRTHAIRRRKFSPYGYYANFDDDGFQMPCRDRSVIDRFRRTFRLDRSTEPGLSLVVPCIAEEVAAVGIAASAVTHYFTPIIRGALEVHVEADDADPLVIRADSIDGVLETVSRHVPDARRARRMFDLTRWAIGCKDGDFIECRLAGVGDTPHWIPEVFGPDVVARLTGSYAGDERIAVRVRMDVARKNGKPEPTHFDVFLEHDSSVDRAEEQFVRGGITITEAGRRSTGKYRALVLVDDPVLVRLLGDSENPSHTEWVERSRIIKQEYSKGPSRIRVVRQSASFIAGLASRASGGIDKAAFRKIFFIPLPDHEDEPERDRTTRPDRIPPLPLPSPPARIHQTERGFRVSGNPDGGNGTAPLTVRVAYDVRRGDPFARHHPMDFDLGDSGFAIVPDGCTFSVVESNSIRLVPERADYELSVEGFDTHRDLKIQVKPVVADDDQET